MHETLCSKDIKRASYSDGLQRLRLSQSTFISPIYRKVSLGTLSLMCMYFWPMTETGRVFSSMRINNRGWKSDFSSVRALQWPQTTKKGVLFSHKMKRFQKGTWSPLCHVTSTNFLPPCFTRRGSATLAYDPCKDVLRKFFCKLAYLVRLDGERHKVCSTNWKSNDFQWHSYPVSHLRNAAKCFSQIQWPCPASFP